MPLSTKAQCCAHVDRLLLQEAEEEEQRQLDREEAKSEEAEERRRAVHRRSASVPSTRARSPPRVPAVEVCSLLS